MSTVVEMFNNQFRNSETSIKAVKATMYKVPVYKKEGEIRIKTDEKSLRVRLDMSDNSKEYINFIGDFDITELIKDYKTPGVIEGFIADLEIWHTENENEQGELFDNYYFVEKGVDC